MISPVNFIWKQLNGPQITAIVRAIYSYVKESFDTTMNYFRDLSLKTANEAHSTLLGTLMGVERPYISAEKIRNFYFTVSKEHPSDNGFSEAPGPDQVGGKFSDQILKDVSTVYLPKVYFSSLLDSIAQSEGLPGSLVLLDDICTYFYNTFRRGDTKDYQISWNPPVEDEEWGPGDITMYIGDTVHWGENTIYVESTLSSLLKAYYMPSQQAKIVFDDIEEEINEG